jgi:hypothetical protein
MKERTNAMAIPKSMDSLTVRKDNDKIKMRDMNKMTYRDLTLVMDTSTKQGLVAFNLVNVKYNDRVS